MTELLDEFARLSPFMLWAAAATALVMLAAVIVERSAYGLYQVQSRRFTERYRPLVERAIKGDAGAKAELVASPNSRRIALAWLLVEPLIENRDPERIARTRALAEAMSLFPLADSYLRSPMWWRRALALRALGLVKTRDRTAQLISALDDAHEDVRAAALDALTDQLNPLALQAVVVRLHDTSLHRGRRGAALRAFGSDCEPFLLEWSATDPLNRLNYIHALAICGTARSRPALCGWTHDPRLEVRATAFEALGYVGVDETSAQVALEGLKSGDPHVRAMAAYALKGWQGPGGAAALLAPHLNDTWEVAVRAARTLKSMGPSGEAELQARASRAGVGGLLARQMLWQPGAGT